MAAGLRRRGINPTTILPGKQDDVIVFNLYLLCLSVLLSQVLLKKKSPRYVKETKVQKREIVKYVATHP